MYPKNTEQKLTNSNKIIIKKNNMEKTQTLKEIYTII